MFRDPIADNDYSPNHLANCNTLANDKDEKKSSSHELTLQKQKSEDMTDAIEFSSLPLNLSCKKQPSDFTKDETGNK